MENETFSAVCLTPKASSQKKTIIPLFSYSTIPAIPF